MEDEGKFNLAGLMHVALFVLALGLRIAASSRIPLNANESSMLLQIPGNINGTESPLSLIESLLIRFTFFLFGQSRFGARIWTIFPGSLIVLLPYFIRNKIGQKLSLIIAVMVSLEPFLLANSLQIGGNIWAILGLSVFLIGLINNYRWLSVVAAVTILLSGRGLLPSLIMLGGLVVIDRYLLKNELLIGINKNYDSRSSIKWFSIAVVSSLFLSAAIITGTDLTGIASMFSAYFPLHSHAYIRTASLGGLPVILISYAPLFVVLFLAYVIRFRIREKKVVIILGSLVIFFVAWLALMPQKMYFDLVWLSLLMIVGSALCLNNIHFETRKASDLGKFSVVLVLIASVFVSFMQFIYQGQQGLLQTNALLNILTLILMVGFIFAAFLSFGQGRHFLSMFGISLLIILLIMQVSFSLRASGFSREIHSELLWSGSIMDSELFKNIVDDRANMKQFVDEKIMIGAEKGVSPQISWELRDFAISYIDEGLSGPIPFKMVFTRLPEIDFRGDYIGQTIIVDGLPKWVESPMSSLFDYDYWSWLFFRKSINETTQNYFWYALD